MHVADPRLAELPAPVRKAFAAADALVVEYVADGYERVRFLEAATFLDRTGFKDVYNLRGGVAAWAGEVDPTMKTY